MENKRVVISGHGQNPEHIRRLVSEMESVKGVQIVNSMTEKEELLKQIQQFDGDEFLQTYGKEFENMTIDSIDSIRPHGMISGDAILVRCNHCPNCKGKLARGKKDKNDKYKRTWTCKNCKSSYKY